MFEKILGFSGEYSFLSNFHPAVVKLDGHEYRTVEHAYQAAKTLDIIERVPFRSNISAGRAKKLGGTLKIREDWEDVKAHVMLDLLRQKFEPGSELAQKLIDTGDAYIEETNTWGDTYWGVCDGKGKNMLGILLMNIREDIKGV